MKYTENRLFHEVTYDLNSHFETFWFLLQRGVTVGKTADGRSHHICPRRPDSNRPVVHLFEMRAYVKLAQQRQKPSETANMLDMLDAEALRNVIEILGCNPRTTSKKFFKRSLKKEKG